MALTLGDVIQKMNAAATEEPNLKPRERWEKVMGLAADFLIKALARDEDKGRVGILMVIPGSHHLTFAYPKHLAKGNVIPIDTNSFAGRALKTKQVLIENHVSREPHLEFYERIRDEKGRSCIIQKMLTAPLLAADGQPIGVIQVSRTGDSPLAAGGDFNQTDAANLAKACRVFATYIGQTWTRE